ncbi:MAG TPA: hypothetical protein VFE31_16870 [Opitutaceae bacterium]|jgi:hypothetical protein|nr:hypothetical protein [Opitutaceae bacterium]
MKRFSVIFSLALIIADATLAEHLEPHRWPMVVILVSAGALPFATVAARVLGAPPQ